MQGINHVTIMGNATDEPVIRSTNSGKKVANFSIATNDSYTDQRTGEKVTTAEYHRIVAWERMADIIGNSLHKGARIYVEGKLTTRKYDKDGVTHSVTEIVVDTVRILDFADDGRASATNKGQYNKPQQAQTQQTYGQAPQGYGQAPVNQPPYQPQQAPMGQAPQAYGQAPAAQPPYQPQQAPMGQAMQQPPYQPQGQGQQGGEDIPF